MPVATLDAMRLNSERAWSVCICKAAGARVFQVVASFFDVYLESHGDCSFQTLSYTSSTNADLLKDLM